MEAERLDSIQSRPPHGTAASRLSPARPGTMSVRLRQAPSGCSESSCFPEFGPGSGDLRTVWRLEWSRKVGGQ